MIYVLLYAGLGYAIWYLFWPKRNPVADLDRARRLLGVSADASQAQINAAHRRLMRKVHPDAGGTEGLAVEINAARDLLLKGEVRR